MEDFFSLDHVSYFYPGNVKALDNITLNIQKGGLYAIIGQNGSGKSTLLNIMNGLIFPASGKINFDGSEISERSLHDKDFNRNFRSRVSYIFQNPDIQLFCPTVMDELMFGPLQMGISQDVARERAAQVLDFVGIAELKDRQALMLSGGEKKKVAIASVLTMNPDVILIDEPIAGLDPKTQTFFIELMISLKQSGKTIVFSTHHLDLIDHLQPTVAVLSEDHTIQRIAPASDILKDEKFLISVNLIHEHIHKHGDEVHGHFHSHYVFHKHE
jgi:cobalt/nickel transport system ATP-binding protein